MSDTPLWAIQPGVPSPHIVAAAVRVARMIDEAGSELTDLARSYHQQSSGAYYPEPDMAKGQALLVDCGLVRREGTRLVPNPELLAIGLEDDLEAGGQLTLRAIATLPPETTDEELRAAVEAAPLSAEQREEFLLALGAKFDDAHRVLVGEIGEELVVLAAKEDLVALGHSDLAAQVRRVSLGSDALGYDITAPRTSGVKRLLETKAGVDADTARFFLSRNEWETGLSYPDDWFLVYCRVDDTKARAGAVLGWCTAQDLADHAPNDHGAGRWSSVCIELPTVQLRPGLPH
jgi:Domain of unknown function (DUF3883)